MVMRKIVAALATSGVVFAGAVDIPEIGVASGASAISIIVGAALVLRSRRRKKADQ